MTPASWGVRRMSFEYSRLLVPPLSVHAEYPCATIVCHVLGGSSPSILAFYVHFPEWYSGISIAISMDSATLPYFPISLVLGGNSPSIPSFYVHYPRGPL